MRNSEMMSLQLTRGQVCDIKRALTHLCCEFMSEVNSDCISEDRRKVASASLYMWERLSSVVKSQIDDFDKNYDESFKF